MATKVPPTWSGVARAPIMRMAVPFELGIMWSMGFPMDLQPIGVNIAERFKSINGVHAIVDTDASIEGRHLFELDAIKLQLKMLRSGIGMAFDAIVTPTAVAAWKT